MAKQKTMFFCQNCGAQSSKWLGRCPTCGEWNTFVEEVIERETGDRPSSVVFSSPRSPVRITEVAPDSGKRIPVPDQELNRVLGGGMVPGSLVLIGGDPGIGKSTLMLQVAMHCKGLKILYISGEESEQQLRMRADRLGASNENCFLLTETNTQSVFRHVEEIKPGMIIVDSIQTLQTDLIESSAGSVSQIRECAAEMQKYSKASGTPVFLIGHITKDGTLAGPKILEHMVDTVLNFEGDRNYDYRILRAVKNRFGSTSELGIYEMRDSGLREVSNPSEILISRRDEEMSGIAIAAMVEGLRPMLIETQALVSSAAYGTPQRSATGFDTRRLNMLLAVLEKRCGFRLGSKDVFLNIAGGIRVDDPAIDLALVAAILSSNEDIPVDSKTCFAGEVGLSGEIRAISRIEQRISEAEKLGFGQMYISAYSLKGIAQRKYSIKLLGIRKVSELYHQLFRN
ncbi:MAG TPA: DNA repair protein RadA [Bacteroidales bacterium]|nr:DNA repair protein RadA [Bacteroidales bacterium]